jgi:predicted transcriptional regulator of viral defense system
MRFIDLVRLLGNEAWFDLATLVQMTGEGRSHLLTQLHRWCAGGRLVSLRRGLYAFAPEFRRREVNPAALAEAIYGPSYLSLHWALGYYGIIPEKVVTFTSVTSRTTKRFENAFGAYGYRHVKPAIFGGYRRVRIADSAILLARPEKALLDLWYLESGPWTPERMAGMRFQNPDVIDAMELRSGAERIDSPRIHAALDAWHEFVQSEREGTVLL